MLTPTDFVSALVVLALFIPLAYYDWLYRKVPKRQYVVVIVALLVSGVAFWGTTSLKFLLIGCTGAVFTLAAIWAIEGFNIRIMAPADVVAFWVLLPVIPWLFGSVFLSTFIVWLVILVFQLFRKSGGQQSLPFISILTVCVAACLLARLFF